MLLKNILNNVEHILICGSTDIEIDDINYDSRNNSKETVFVSVSGDKRYIYEAVDRGAKAIVVPYALSDIKCKPGITIVSVEDTRKALAYMSANYFEHPQKNMFTIGITGTKGKTTTAYMIHTILETNGIKTGLIGTIETIYNEEWYPQKNTTPESYTIFETFENMYLAGCRAVVMEVSSQALKMSRCEGIIFDIGVFTNISPDHIGKNEHKDFEDYLMCKSKLFRQCKLGIVNNDDKYTDRIVRECTCRLESYGIEKASDIMAAGIDMNSINDEWCSRFTAKGYCDTEILLSVPGMFNIYNSLCAISVARHLDVSNILLSRALNNVVVRGRIELVPTKYPFTVIIDYAHNAISLENLLRMLRSYNPGRLICCFGCGGNRDRKRRYEMGKVSGELSDITIVTSDNPRTESPKTIIDDICAGLSETSGSYIVIEDRREAIEYAIKAGRPKDIIVFAGKGHEDYQEIGNTRVPFNERLIIRDIQKEG